MDRESAGEENTRQDVLREYQEKYRILTDLIPLGAFRLGPAPDYRVISTNRMFPQMLGFDSGDVIEGIPAGSCSGLPCRISKPGVSSDAGI